MTRQLHVGYLSRYLPSPSETFVLDEALSLLRMGARVQSIAIDRVRGSVRHARFEALYKNTLVLPRSSHPAALYASLVMDSHPLMPVVRTHWNAVTRGRDLRRAALLALRLRSLKVDVLRVHHAAETARFGAVAAILAGVPLSLAVHGRDLFVPVSDLGWILNQAQHVTTVTPFHRERLLRAGLPSEQVTVLPCTVELPDRVATPPSEGPFRVLSVGRLVSKKGHDLLVEACASLASEGRHVTLVIVGGGAQGLALRQLASERIGRSMGRFAVEFRGEEPAETVRSLMLDGGFHCFALACRVAADGDRDGLPVSLLEAQACGLPTITTNLPGFESQLENDRGGILLPLASGRRRETDARGPDWRSVKAALGYLFDAPPVRGRMALAARHEAEARMTPQESGDKLHAMLNRLAFMPVYDTDPPETL